MALTGSLRDFGISEILQLIGHQQKSGTMVVTGGKREVTVLFDKGQIVEVAVRPEPPEYDLGQMLSQAGLLHPSQLEMAKEQQKETLQPLDLILVKSKAVALEDLKDMKRLRCLEILYDLFLWKDGDYQFEAGSVNYLDKFTLPISSEQVLMDGYRIKDEWPLLAQKIGSLDRCYHRTGAAARDDLDPLEQKILRLVQEDRSVRELIPQTRRGKFETLKVLIALLDRGLIEPCAHAKAAAGVKSRAQQIVPLAAYLVVGLLFLFCLNGLRLNLRRTGLGGAAAPAADGRRALLAASQLYPRLEHAAETYRLLHGQNASSAAALAEAGLLRSSDLRWPGRLLYRYRPEWAGSRFDDPAAGGRETP